MLWRSCQQRSFIPDDWDWGRGVGHGSRLRDNTGQGSRRKHFRPNVRIDAGGTAQSIPAMEKRGRASRALWTLGKSSETTPAHWGSFAQSTQESIRKTKGTGQLTWGSFAQSTQEVESLSVLRLDVEDESIA